jgi:hypothetical protein
MPDARPYGHRWRTVTRPRILARDGNRCRRCGRAVRLDVAHLDQNSANDDETNLAALCRLDHRRHDLATWRRKCHETRAARKDAARPLLWH